MRSLKRNVVVVLLAAVLAGAFAPSAAFAQSSADMLKMVPGDAWGFVMLRSLKTIDDKAQLLQETLNLPIPAPVTPLLLAQLNAGDTIEMNRPFCLVAMDIQKLGMDKAFVMLVPAKDPKALLEKLMAEEAEEGVSACTVMGQPAFAAIKEKVVILGPDKDTVAKVAKSQKTADEGFDKARLEALNKSDFYISASLASLWTAYGDMAKGFLTMAMAATDPSGKSAEGYLKVFEEMAALDLALSLDKNAVNLSILVLPKTDSDLEKMMADQKPGKESPLKLLPKEKYLLAFGGAVSFSEHTEKFASGTDLSSILKSAEIPGLNEDAVKKLDKGLKNIAKATTGYALSAAALPAGPDGMIGLTVVLEVKDSKECIADLRKMYKAIWEASEDEDLATVKQNITHAADAETVGDDKIDTITVNLEGLAEEMDLSDDDLAGVKKIVGEKIMLRFGPAGGKHVVVTFGGGKKRFEAVHAGLKSGGGGLSDDSGIRKVAGQLPSPRIQEGFVAVDNILTLVKDVAKALGEEEEFPFELAAIEAPLAFATSMAGTCQRTDLLIPMKLITSVKELIETQMAAESDAFDEEDEEGDDEEGDDEEGDDEEGDDEEMDDSDDADDEEGDDDDAEADDDEGDGADESDDADDSDDAEESDDDDDDEEESDEPAPARPGGGINPRKPGA